MKGKHLPSMSSYLAQISQLKLTYLLDSICATLSTIYQKMCSLLLPAYLPVPSLSVLEWYLAAACRSSSLLPGPPALR